MMVSNAAIYLLVLALTFSAGRMVAQSTSPSDLDQKYTPNDASPFNKTNKKKSNVSSSSVEIKNAFKFSPTLLFRQKVGFFYEREIVSGLSLYLGVGKAFGTDFLQNVYLLNFINSIPDDKVLDPSTLMRESEFYSSKLFFQPGLRVYFSGETFDGGFFEVNMRRETISYQVKPRLESFRIEGVPIVDWSMWNFNFGFGATNVTGNRKRMVHEFYMLIGVKNFLYNRLELTDYTQTQGTSIYRYTGGTMRVRIIPSFNIGYSLGFGL